MFNRSLILLPLCVILLAGCTPTRSITYYTKGIDPVPASDPRYAATRTTSLAIEPFEDLRRLDPENGVMFVHSRETELDGKHACVNSEEHYKENTVPSQIASIMAQHIERRKSFKAVSAGKKAAADYRLTGKIKRFYGEQEFSETARVGSAFGLVGALATAGAETRGTIVIEFTDLVLHREKDGAGMKLKDVVHRIAGDMHADGYCWCIYDNVNAELKNAVDSLAVSVEKGVGAMELSKSSTSSLLKEK